MVATGPSAWGASGPGAELFGDGPLPRVQLEVPAPAILQLRESPRTYVRVAVRESTNVYDDVAMRVKGRSGSFRDIDDKPSLTLDFERFRPGRRYHGLSKLHFNNSVEDASYLHEWLGAGIFRSAGMPAPRVGHVMVDMNGRRLGLYVMKEGFAGEFLGQYFARTDGDLFEPEPGSGADVTGPMRRHRGSGTGEGAELQRLADAARVGDLASRWDALNEILDTDRFLSFVALEILLGHRDGYSLARNNYRLYLDPAAGKFVFLPGGMDNLLGRATAPLRPRMVGVVATAMMEIPEARRRYHVRLGEVFTNWFRVRSLTNDVARRAGILMNQLPRDEAGSLRDAAANLCQRIEERAREVELQLSVSDPAPLKFVAGVASLGGWRASGVPSAGVMTETNWNGVGTLHVQSASRCAAAWRAGVWLMPGRYRFEGRARARNVQPIPFARSSGVSLGVPGRGAGDSLPLTGNHDWTALQVEFVVANEDENVVLQCSLRAESGNVWFDRNSLRLRRIGDR